MDKWKATQMIRKAQTTDLAELTSIYNQAIGTGRSTADTTPFTVDSRSAWFFEHTNDPRTPIYVYEENGAVAGYCYLSAYRPDREALKSIAEISYYVDGAHQRKGIGTKLLTHIIAAAKELAYANLLAIVLSCNESSIALLEKFGFSKWGELPNIVSLHENVYSHYYLGQAL